MAVLSSYDGFFERYPGGRDNAYDNIYIEERDFGRGSRNDGRMGAGFPKLPKSHVLSNVFHRLHYLKRTN